MSTGGRNPLLTNEARAFLADARFVSVATTDEDGSPRQAVTWYRLEPDDRILINGRLPRRWCVNLSRDRRVSLSVLDGLDGYRWLGLTGVVDSISDDVERARDDIVALANRYHPDGPDPASIAAFRSQPRISYLVRITGVHDHLED
jgi:PPOX class probable F420-dependent enzyme